MAGTLQLAWRNLGRNRRRTCITGLALTIGVGLSVATFGLIDGTGAALLRGLTRYELGHVQVHTRAYQKTRKAEETIPDYSQVIASVRGAEGVVGASGRVYLYGLTSLGERSAGLEIVGVDPRTETQVTELHTRMTGGRYLDAEPTPWPEGRALTEAEKAQDQALTAAIEAEALAEIAALEDEGETASGDAAAPSSAADPAALSRKLAELQSPPPERPPRVILGSVAARILRAEVGDTVHLSAGAVDGTMQDVDVEIAGTFTTGTAQLDRRLYMHLADLQRLGRVGDRVHEIAAVVDDTGRAAAVSATIDAALGQLDLLVRPWSEIRPDIQSMVDSSRNSMMVLIVVIFFVSALGVINTMLMSVLERTREFGVLKAIGMGRGRVFGLIVLEAAILVVAAGLVGTAVGLGIDLYMVHVGVDLSSMTEGVSVGGVGLDPVLRGAITAEGLLVPIVILTVICVTAACYPALRAARLRPAVGMRET